MEDFVLCTLLRQAAENLETQRKTDEPRGLWQRKKVAEYLGIGLDKLDEYRTTESFPKPLTLNGEARMLRWVPDEVEAWALGQRASF